MKKLARRVLLAGVLMLPACAVPLAGSERPATNGIGTFESTVGRRIELGNRAVTPLAVLEDSRCPANVQCIQAGTVRLQVRLEEAGRSWDAVVGLKQPAALENAWLHLLGVCPPRPTPERPAERDYRLTFAIASAADPPPVEVRCR